MSSNPTSTVPYLDLEAQNGPLHQELLDACDRVLKHGGFCLGPEVEAFEREFAEVCGIPHVVAVNSGTSALHLATRLLDLGPGDEVITTPYTFVATAWAISYVGATPVFVDIEPETFNLDPSGLEKALTSKTRAILPVHLYGHPYDVAGIHTFARAHDLPVIEDAAQAHGASWQGQPVGSWGSSTCFSFYPTKNLGAIGEGGALVTQDATLAERARALRVHGSRKRYHYDEVGYNYRMEGIQAAALRVKLRHLKTWQNSRARIAEGYARRLADTPLRLPMEKPGYESAWHLYVVRHERRDELAAALHADGIGNGIHYPLPLHLQECYRDLGYQEGDFPVSEQVSRECLCLPFFAELTEEQLDRVSESIHRFFA